MRILEQGVSNLEEGDGNVKAVGMLNLYERVNFQDSMKKLEAVHDHATPLDFRVKTVMVVRHFFSWSLCVSATQFFPFPFLLDVCQTDFALLCLPVGPPLSEGPMKETTNEAGPLFDQQMYYFIDQLLYLPFHQALAVNNTLVQVSSMNLIKPNT